MCTGFYLQINEIINNYKRNFKYINLECRSYQNRICSSYLTCSGMYCILKIDMLGVSWEIISFWYEIHTFVLTVYICIRVFMMNKLIQISLRVHLSFPAFMPCTTVVAYRVLQVFHYHSIYIFPWSI